MSGNVLHGTVMLLAGIGIPVMAALNGGLGLRLQSSALAACLLFAVALSCAVLYWRLSGERGDLSQMAATPWYLFLGGSLTAFYITTITHIAPKFGMANAVSFVLLGQLIAIAFIDHTGFLGLPQTLMSPRRMLGLLVMAVGVFLVLSPKMD